MPITSQRFRELAPAPITRIPMMRTPSIAALFRRLVPFAFLALATLATAAEHGEGSEKAAGFDQLLFTVNVGEAVDRYLQVTMAFDTAGPEVAAQLAALKPKLQHRIILMLCGETADNLRTAKGKTELQERIRSEVNELIDEKPKTGVRDVFFTNFIIQ